MAVRSWHTSCKMPLSDFINVQISIDSIGIARAGFGIPLILSANAAYPDRVRFYASLVEVAVDFALTSPEYLAARNMFAQDNIPQVIAIGRCALKPTQQYTIGAAQVLNSTVYNIRARGQGVTDTTATTTSGVAASLEAIHSALVTSLNAVVGKNFTATFAPLTFTPFTFTASVSTMTATAHGRRTGDGPVRLTTTTTLPTGLALATDYWVIRQSVNSFSLATSLANALAGTVITTSDTGTGTHTLSVTVSTVGPADPFLVTGNTAGAWFSLEILDSAGNSSSLATSFLTNAQTHVDPGVATDLTAIDAENSSWYAVYPLYNSKAYALGVMAYIEGAPKVTVVDSCDSHIITAAAGGTDVADSAKALSYDRTLGNYHPSPIDFLGAALMGQVLPLAPGAETWAFKSNLSGVRGVSLSGTHRANLRAKNWNTYEPQTSDITWTWDGKTPGGEFFDTVRGLDKVKDDAVKSLAEVLANDPKVPYTDGGALRLGNELEGVFARAVNDGIFAADPEPVVVIPRVASQSSANRRIRKFAGLKGSATLAGAIQFLNPVSIIVTQ